MRGGRDVPGLWSLPAARALVGQHRAEVQRLLAEQALVRRLTAPASLDLHNVLEPDNLVDLVKNVNIFCL